MVHSWRSRAAFAPGGLHLRKRTSRPSADAAGPAFAEAHFFSENLRAGDGIRTRDPKLGKLVLYQLSYSRAGGGL